MATYVETASGIMCTGSDITSEGLYDFVNGHPSRGEATRVLPSHPGALGSYIFELDEPDLQIGDGTGTVSVWNPQNEMITIKCEYLKIDGPGAVLRVGTSGANGPQNQCSFTFACLTDAGDRWQLNNGSTFEQYGGMLVHTNPGLSQARIRPSANATVILNHVDARLSDGIAEVPVYLDPPLAGFVVDYTGSTFSGNVEVGLRLYDSSAANTTADGITVFDSQWAIWPGEETVTLVDAHIDNNAYHARPNNYAATLVLLNPDFLVLRLWAYSSADLTYLYFRYDLEVATSDAGSSDGGVVRIIDQSSTVVGDNETLSGGTITTGVPVIAGSPALLHATWAGMARTRRAIHSRNIAHYSYDIRADTVTVIQDLVDRPTLTPDASITVATRATVQGYSTVDNAEEFYDYAKSLLIDNYDNEAEPYVSRISDAIDLGALDLTIDSSSGSVMTVTASSITIKATLFTGDITTTGTVTLTGSTVDGIVTDSTGTTGKLVVE